VRESGSCRANRTREAGSRDEAEGAVANTLDLQGYGAVGFIVWLDLQRTLVLPKFVSDVWMSLQIF
jgi:hypothetical protein